MFDFLYEKLKGSILDLGYDVGLNFSNLTRPSDDSHGDWTTNVALIIAGKEGKKPREIAGNIKEYLENDIKLKEKIKSVEIAGPGFINFTIKEEYYFEVLYGINKNYGYIKTDSPQRIMLEYGHPNTHKMPHVGHLYSYICGNSLARILEANGHEVCHANYQGDVGPHVAKCIYGWIENGRIEPTTLLEKVKHLQECYQLGSSLYESDEEAKQKINEINKAIYDPNSKIQEDWLKTRQWSLDFYLQFEKRLGIEQKFHYLESQVWQKGLETVKEKTPKVFKEDDGAVIFPGEDFNLHNRVFITKNGTSTYECKEVGLNQHKMEDWEYDLTIIPTASEQNEYFKVVIKAIEEAVPRLKGKIKHIGFGMVSLSIGKMSSRKGNILSGPDLVEKIKGKIREIVETRENFNEEKKENVSEKVTLAAVKYTFLKSNILQNMVFDINESVSFDGNSGPYLQYVYARIQSVLRQKTDSSNAKLGDLKNLTNQEEVKLIKLLERFPETVKTAGETYSPHIISNYVFNLAGTFNTFYKNHSINNDPDPKIVSARRLLSEKTAIIIKNGLSLLGIEVVESM